MSVFSNLKAYSRKPVAVIMAALVATSSVPVTPLAQATAAFADGAKGAKAAKADAQLKDSMTLAYDTHKAPDGKAMVDGKLTVSDFNKAAFAFLKDKGAISLPTATDSVITDQVYDAIRKLAEEDDKNDYALVANSIEVTYKDAFEDAALAVDAAHGEKASAKVENDVATIEATGVTDEDSPATLTVSGSKVGYTIAYRYTKTPKPTEPEQPTDPDQSGTGTENPGETAAPEEVKPVDGEEISGEYAFAGDAAPKATISLTVTDYWAGTPSGTVPADNLDVTWSPKQADGKSKVLLANAPAGLVCADTTVKDRTGFEGTIVYEEGAWYLKVIKTGPVSASPHTVKATFSYPDGQDAFKATTKVTIGKKAIDGITIEDEPFRLQADQEDQVLADANEAVRAMLKKNGIEAKADYYKSVSFGSYDATGAHDQTVQVTFTKNDGLPEVFGNLDIADPSSVTVKAMESTGWKNAAGLKLASTYNEGDDGIDLSDANKGTWVKSVPTASWSGHTLSYGARTVPTDEKAFSSKVELSAGDGVHSLELYARDADDVVTRVTGISYKLDTQAPELNGAEVHSSRSKTLGGIFFGDTVIDVNFSLVDAVKAGTSDKDALDKLSSGVDKGSVSASYDDNESGERGIPADVAHASATEHSFSISGDKDVDTKDIHIKAVDNAGNVLKTTADKNRGIPTDITKLVAESSGPSIDISWDTKAAANGKYYNTNRTMTVTVREAFFNYTRTYANNVILTVKKDGKVVSALRPTDFTQSSSDSNEWTYTLPFTADGDYEVSSAVVSDIVGHTKTAAGDTFTIDKTAPAMQVTFDNDNVRNGKYYNAARTATITVTEHNFDPSLMKIETTASAGNGEEVGQPSISGWSNNGDVHTATVTFPGQGVYTLAVNGEDLATNKLEGYTAPEFVVDTVKPKIDIADVVNKTAYAGDVAPKVSVHDTNLDPASTIDVSRVSYPLSDKASTAYSAKPSTTATDMKVGYANPLDRKENDGVYTITVQAADLAGNTDSQAVTWSVNRFGSTYVISDDTGKMIDKYLKSDDTVDVKVTEINPSGLDDAKTAVELTRDTKNSTLKSGDDYKTDENTSTGWHEYTYTVDKGNYGKDGAYRVLFHSQDLAGNASENTMEGKNAKKEDASAEVAFAVDDTKPIASFVDLEDNGKYEEAEHTAKVSFEDNLKLAKAEIKVNGETVGTYDANQLESNPVKEFKIDGSNDRQDVSVKVWDEAGNESDELKASGILVTNDALVLWMNNTPLFAGSIAAIVIVAGGIFLALAKRRKGDDGEAAA